MNNVIKKIFFSLTGALSLLYLLNIGSGVIELIPDNIPLLGNLDEATAVLLLLNSLRYFGIDLMTIFERHLNKSV